MIKLLEKELLIKCRREDINLLKQLIPECEREFVETMKREASNSGIEYKTKLTLVENEFLTGTTAEAGGMLLTSLDKRIVCNNTLQSRLDLCFEELLP